MISPAPVITTSSAALGRILELQLAAVSHALFPPPPSHVTVAAYEWMRKRDANRIRANRLATFITTLIKRGEKIPKELESANGTLGALAEGTIDCPKPKKWWRRRELNPRPWQINQQRLHA